MPVTYKKLDEIDHIWADARAMVNTIIAQDTRRIKNIVLNDLHASFDAALLDGRVIEVSTNREAIKNLVARTVRKELGAGK
jgi:hypothetical protein